MTQVVVLGAGVVGSAIATDLGEDNAIRATVFGVITFINAVVFTSWGLR